VIRRRRGPSGGGTGRGCLPTPSRAEACPAGSPGPRVDLGVADRAQVRPVIAEIEHVGELLTRAQPRQPDAPVVLLDLALDLPVRIRIAQPRTVSQGELLKVRAVPPGEGIVDGRTEVAEGVTASRREDPSRPWPQVLAVPLYQVHADRQPRPRHLTPPRQRWPGGRPGRRSAAPGTPG
jgi:hypothetical protein